MDKLTLSVSLSHKVNLGNYESGEVFISVSGIGHDTTEAEIDELIAGPGALAYKKCAAALREKVATARKISREVA